MKAYQNGDHLPISGTISLQSSNLKVIQSNMHIGHCPTFYEASQLASESILQI